MWALWSRWNWWIGVRSTAWASRVLRGSVGRATYGLAVNVLTTLRDYEAWAASVPNRVLVPTMGALHDGHASLVTATRAARPSAAVVVTVFVNPTQFNEAADYQRYPKTLDADAALCKAAGAACVLAPTVADVYPNGPHAGVPPLPRVATDPGLEDAHRPGHFAGVCQVVKRLFEMTRPVAAIFGEKDWQQLQVIRAMTAEQGMRVEIVASPTVRDADGMAMSSRNRFLSQTDRQRALAISRALQACRHAATPADAERVMQQELAGLNVEYAAVRESESLTPREGRQRALIAVRVGPVRLIDNAAWGTP